MPRAARRSLALLTAFGLSLLATGGALLAGLERSGLPHPTTVLDQLGGVLRSVQVLGSRPADAWDVVAVGDSQLMRAGGLPLHAWVERALWQQRRDAAVWRVAVHGLGVFGHYCISDRVAATAPDRVVVELNLADFSRDWRAASQASYAGALAPRRWMEAAELPLARVGVSLDQLLFESSVVAAGGLQRWRWLQGEQARAALLPSQLAAALQARSPWPDGLQYERALTLAGVRGERVPGATRRASVAWARRVLGAALAGAPPEHPALRFLDALLAHYAEAGIPTLVFVHPVNVEHLARLGLDTRGLAVSVESARQVASARGADFLDLHALLPDAAFRDEMDHLDVEAGGTERVGRAIAAALLAAPRQAGSQP